MKMKMYIDDVRVDKIKELMDIYPVDGVTSNPTILKKGGKAPLEVLKEIRAMVGDNKVVMTQVVSTVAEDMMKEAEVILNALGKKNTYVKIPVNAQGLKAIRLLREKDADMLLCATAVYSVAQGLLAAQAGANIVAPYVNRIDNLGGDGLAVAKDIHDIIKAYDLPCGVIAASFKTTRQVIEMAKYGVEGAAIGVDVWESFLKNYNVDMAVDVFNHDFEDLAGKGKTFNNI